MVRSVAQGTSLIDQTTMAVDASDRPLLATGYTPFDNVNDGPVSATNNPNR